MRRTPVQRQCAILNARFSLFVVLSVAEGLESVSPRGRQGTAVERTQNKSFMTFNDNGSCSADHLGQVIVGKAILISIHFYLVE